MLKQLFDVNPDETDFEVQFSLQQDYWAIALICLAGFLMYSIYLYKSESWLSQNRRMVMGGAYLLAGFLLVFILLEPVLQLESKRPQKRTFLVLVDASQSMGIKDQLQEEKEILDAARIMNLAPLNENEKTKDAAALQKELDEREITRLALAKAAVQHPEIGIPNTLGEEYDVRYYTFGDRLNPVSGGQESTDLLSGRAADANSSRIGSAIEEAMTRHAGQPLAGVVLLSDFAWIKGSDPIEVARKAKKQEVPIYCVPIGLPAPPDLRVKRIIAPEVAFMGDSVPVRVQIDSSGFDGETAQVSLNIDEEEVDVQRPTLTGRSQFLEFNLKGNTLTSTGTKKLVATIKADSLETTEENNQRNHKMRIIDEKINVLYVEGMPRWEFRYLRWVLRRDPRLRVRFLMTQGDNELAYSSTGEHLSSFPTKKEDILKYDLIILGDVRSTYFKTEQIDTLEKLVKEGGGSLLMLAGPMGSPNSYADKKKIADMLPVKITGGNWRGVSSQTHPKITAAGLESTVVNLAPDPTKLNQNNRIWSLVRPMGYLPQLDGPKPGATTLLTLTGSENDAIPYPLVAWHRYGIGKTMYVGTADLWRLRREVGDRFHARFWGQAIQFLALSRILGQNKQITLETSRKQYATGERIDLFANVLTEAFEPVDQGTYSVNLKHGSETVDVVLSEVPGSKGLYSGSILAEEEGNYVLSAKGPNPSLSNKVEFEVEHIPLEQRETAMMEDVANQVAALSGGLSLPAKELGALPELLRTEEETDPLTIVREKALWDVPVIFIILVVLTGLEWYLRRRENLV